MALSFHTDETALPLYLVETEGVERWLADQSEPVRRWVEAHGFSGQLGHSLVLPGPAGAPAGGLAGYGDATSRSRARFALAGLARSLPEGSYRLAMPLPEREAEEFALGWLLGSYGFGRYKSVPPAQARLVAPEGVDAARLEAIAAGEALTRDLINTPAEDMGPDALETAFLALGEQHGARAEVTSGAALGTRFPMIHTVGRAAQRPPRLLDMEWGTAGPRLTLVGKGVCFDTGGLDLKPAAAMGLMKKDMGGAATVLGLASMIMELGLEIRLRVLIPAVENAVAGDAFRPGDILTSRKGLTVEVNNTDAEGRLVLADALALADEEETDLIVSMATLTGAARVAVGPDLAPFYTDDDALAATLAEAGQAVADPVWRMPFWEPYEAMIEPGIADLDNAPKGGFAGSITAALFLRRFVEARYLHFDIYGWQPKSAPGRPMGGVGQGARALLEALPRILAK